MNKIIFVQREMEDRLGAMILSAYLKSHGFDTEIVIESRKKIKEVISKKPDFIGISVMTPSVDWALNICKVLKKNLPETLIILGGPHPTFYPQVIEEKDVDIICIGEGEKPLLEVMKNFDGTLESVANTPNLWIKNNGTITKNKPCSLLTVEELSNLPFCDRSHYINHPTLNKTPLRRFLTSRGCPFSCSYCFNSGYKKIYEKLGIMVRQRTVDSVIEELKELKKIGVQVVDFSDDQFLLSKDWTKEFCDKYKKEISIPFVINSIAKFIDNENVKELKRAGCWSVNFAIESGVEQIRRTIYGKPTSDEEIYRASEALNSNDMPFVTYNMIGLPDESLEDIFRTIEINQQIDTTYPWCSILQPYPGTKIADYVREKRNMKEDKFSYSYFQSGIIGDPVQIRIYENSQKLFAYLVKNKIGYEKFKKLVHDNSIVSRFYPLAFYWHYGQGIKRRYRYSWTGLFKYWLYSRNTNHG
jgi:anaerobic magnesium-protoporphyrin IX monomethyl ester cyclase